MPRVGPRKIKKGDRNKKERFVVLEEMIQEPLFGSLLLFFLHGLHAVQSLYMSLTNMILTCFIEMENSLVDDYGSPSFSNNLHNLHLPLFLF